MREHDYRVSVTWADAAGTADYRSYTRSHAIVADGKPPIEGSSVPMFRGDASRYNPEELLVAALSSCHMLWFLHLCADAGIVVTEYRDDAVGTMHLNADGSGEFARVVLDPHVLTTAPVDPERTTALHTRAHHLCFIARSVNFPVEIAAPDSATT